MTRSILVVLFAAACGGNPVEVGKSDSNLLGAVSYASDCNATDKPFLDKAIHYGRTVATSAAFAQCMDRAVRTGTSGFGPYMKCNGDPYYSATIDTQIAKAIQMAHSNDDVAVHCTGGAGNASASLGSASDWGHSGDEAFSFSGWLHAVDTTLSLPVCGTPGASPTSCRFAGEPWPWDQTAGIFWHEASHTHGYTHGANDQANAKIACGYALNTDHTLWRGTINHSDWLTSTIFGRARHCDGTRLVE